MPEAGPERTQGPIEIRDAIPASVVCFAEGLVERRMLAASLEVPKIGAANSLADLRGVAAVEALAGMPGFEDWLAWVAHWTKRFGELSDANAVSLRMSHSRQATCPRFHRDAVHMRLIATLLGPGTEWLRANDVTHSSDGSIGQSPEPDTVQRMAQHSVGIFMGSAFDPATCLGVVHRSPHDQVDRVVMTFDIAA